MLSLQVHQGFVHFTQSRWTITVPPYDWQWDRVSHAAIELPRVRTRSTKDSGWFRLHGSMTSPLHLHSTTPGKRNSSLHLWLVAPRMRSIWYIVWTTMANLMRHHRTRSRKLPQTYSVTNLLYRTSLDQSPYGPPKCWDRSAVIKLRTSCTTWNLYRELLVPGSLLACCASFVTGCARLKDFTLRAWNSCVVLDVRLNPTPSLTTTNALFCVQNLFLLRDRLPCFHGEVIFSMN